MRRLILLLGLVLMPVASVGAVSFEVGDSLFFQEPVEDDLYVAGNRVQIDEKVVGDLIIAGGVVMVEGDVVEDLMVLGGDVTIDGRVGDDLKVMGGNVVLNGTVEDDVIGAGGSLSVGKGANVQGSVNMAGGVLVVESEIGEDFNFHGGTLILDGVVKGNALVRVENLILGENAWVEGDFDYTGQEELVGVGERVGGEVRFSAVKEFGEVMDEHVAQDFWTGARVWGAVYSFLSLIFLGFLFWLVSPRILVWPAETLLKKPLLSLGLGLVLVVLMPVVALMFLFSFVGVPVSVLLFVGWGVALYLAKIFVAGAMGLLVLPVRKPLEEKGRVLGAYALGLVFYEVLANIPLFGTVFLILVSVMGVGALALTKVEVFQSLRDKKII